MLTLAAAGALLALAAPASAQTWSVEDPVLRAIWDQGMNQSQVMKIAQTMMDSIGPRLTGTPNHKAGVDWAVRLLQSWGAEARAEQYGTWHGWRRGISHIDLIQPRVRSLDGMMLGYSPPTPGGRPVEAAVVHVPVFESAAQYEAWIPSVRGKIVASAFPQPTCRPMRQYEEFGATLPGGGGGPPQAGGQQPPRTAAEALQQRRAEAQRRFTQNRPPGNFRNHLQQAGAVAILESNWLMEFGIQRIFDTNTTIPVFDLECEDYGLVYRLAANNQGPVLRVTAQAENLGTVPVFNVVGSIRGSQLPNEYVMFSAHFDSWDGGSGATDNGTGSSMMLEAMRILRSAYPNPKRTIMIGLWGGEEQGLNGSRRFVGMHPEIVAGMQALFNQDNGTGRIQSISTNGFLNVGGPLASWVSRLPSQLVSQITLNIPGQPGSGGSDHASFVCAGAPALGMSGLGWGYGQTTWHSNLDTFDKIVEEDLRNNATLVAMLAYLASEHPEKLARDKRTMGVPQWPACQPGAANSPRTPPGGGGS
jgi:hypothetical protein